MQAGVRPGMQAVSRADGRSVQFSQQNARGPLVGNSHVNELSNGQQNSLEMKGQIAAETENKVGSLPPPFLMEMLDMVYLATYIAFGK